jgi:hypothetical protein
MPMVATQGIELLVIDVEQDLNIDINTLNLIFSFFPLVCPLRQVWWVSEVFNKIFTLVQFKSI